jgi:hypothetical protein
VTASKPAGQARRLLRVTEILALGADDQLDYLHGLGIEGLVDELALQFDDSFVVLPELRLNGLVSEDAERALQKVDEQLVAMGETGPDVWTEPVLANSEDWRRVRTLAATAAATLRGDLQGKYDVLLG